VAQGFHGVVTGLRESPGLNIVRVAHQPGQRIATHSHDWPCLTLHRCGSYVERVDGAELFIDRPAAAYHPAGCAHANTVGPYGLETVSILFDPSILPAEDALPLAAGRIWIGGRIGRLGSIVANELTVGRAQAAEIIGAFLRSAFALPASPKKPAWLERLDEY